MSWNAVLFRLRPASHGGPWQVKRHLKAFMNRKRPKWRAISVCDAVFSLFCPTDLGDSSYKPWLISRAVSSKIFFLLKKFRNFNILLASRCFIQRKKMKIFKCLCMPGSNHFEGLFCALNIRMQTAIVSTNIIFMRQLVHQSGDEDSVEVVR